MFLNCILLAISVSIDSFGIGITYGIKKTKLLPISRFILFAISFTASAISIHCGNIIKNILSSNFAQLLGTTMLILIGINIILQSLKVKHISCDFDNSNFIDAKESIFLSLAISLDAFCIGFSSGIMGISSLYFPLFVAIFHISFLQIGISLGYRINKLSKLPDNVWSFLSGFLLICIGFSKFFM